jgi:DNA transformation protein and related proteins
MFGAHGLYSRDKFFGILDAGRLFFKIDAVSQRDYTARGLGAFTYESEGRRTTMAHHEVPPDVFEDAPKLTSWARRAIQVTASSKKSGRLTKRR